MYRMRRAPLAFKDDGGIVLAAIPEAIGRVVIIGTPKMKLCQCCGQTAEDNQATCSACGEASWVATEPFTLETVKAIEKNLEANSIKPQGRRR